MLDSDETVYYSYDDIWIRKEESDVYTAGMAARILVDAGPVAYISFTRNIINGSVYKDEIIGSIEFLGSFFDIKSPLDGVIVEVNESITETPDLIVSDPYHGGWLFRMELSDPAELLDLMDEERYLQCFM